jgi:hypothetical protein
MRTLASIWFVVLLLSLSVRTIAEQSTQPNTAKKKPAKVVSLTGCVQPDESTPQQFVIEDATQGRYRLSGKDLREYLGRRVVVDGGVVVKGVAIKGGLTPNPNIAAQAGALDPSRAAVQAATQPSGPVIDPGLPEFRVKKIAASTGSCDQP